MVRFRTLEPMGFAVAVTFRLIIGNKYSNGMAAKIFSQNQNLNSGFGPTSTVLMSSGGNILVAGYNESDMEYAGNQLINDMLLAYTGNYPIDILGIPITTAKGHVYTFIIMGSNSTPTDWAVGERIASTIKNMSKSWPSNMTLTINQVTNILGRSWEHLTNETITLSTPPTMTFANGQTATTPTISASYFLNSTANLSVNWLQFMNTSSSAHYILDSKNYYAKRNGLKETDANAIDNATFTFYSNANVLNNVTIPESVLVAQYGKYSINIEINGTTLTLSSATELLRDQLNYFRN